MEFTNQATVGDDGSDSGDEDGRQDAAITAEIQDLQQQVNDVVGKVALGSTIFDYCFHQLYFEDNPDVIQALKLKTMLSFCIQLLVIDTVLTQEYNNLDPIIHYGAFETNIVRTISTLILHLAMMGNFVKAKAMIEFMIANATKFASGSIVFPALVCILRIIIACMLQFGGMYQLMFTDDGKTALNISIKLAVIGSFEGKFSGLIVGVDLGSVIAAKPMQYSRTANVKRTFSNALSLVNKYFRGEIKTDFMNVLICIVMAPIQTVLALFYVTCYYYLLPFVPLTMVVLGSYWNRHSPEQV
jgi:hypothetical protein